MHWFGGKLYPRFTDIEAQRKHLYSSGNQLRTQDYLIQAAGQIDRDRKFLGFAVTPPK